MHEYPCMSMSTLIYVFSVRTHAYKEIDVLCSDIRDPVPVLDGCSGMRFKVYVLLPVTQITVLTSLP